MAPQSPHFAPRAKRVIYLFMAGGPSQLELLDHKPELAKWGGKLPPAELLKGYRAAFISPSATLLGPKFTFARHGDSGAEVSELLPHLAGVVDDIAIVKSMHTDAFNHAPGQIFMNTGSQQFGRPSMGAWATYGLGSESQDLPAYVVFSTGTKGTSGGSSNWGCGFLPSVYQGVPFRNTGDPVLYLSNPPGFDVATQRDSLDAIRRLNQARLRRRRRPGDRHADQLVRDGVPDADQRPRADGHLPRVEGDAGPRTAPSRARPRSPAVACWPAGWSSAASASCRSSTRRGTTTAAWSRA